MIIVFSFGIGKVSCANANFTVNGYTQSVLRSDY